MIENQLISRQDGSMRSLCSRLLCLAFALPALADKLQYNRDVRPILSDDCFRPDLKCWSSCWQKRWTLAIYVFKEPVNLAEDDTLVVNQCHSALHE